MKTLSFILLTFILIALCFEECVAQGTSSASQIVTFGVRRLSTPSLVANFSSINPDNQSTTLSPTTLKLTIGSDVRSEEIVVGVRTSAVKKMRRQQTVSSDEFVMPTSSQPPYRYSPPKSVITVTE